LLAAACAAVTMLPRAAAQDARDPAGGIDAIRPGDRIVLYVEGEKWPNDTFTVREGPAIDLPEFGHVSLAGVDKSEIQEYLKGQLGKYLKTPVLRARVLVRVGILGELTRPGFYNLPADALVSDALTAAGPTNNSRMAKATVVRAGATVMKSDSLNRAIAAGLTLGQVGLQSGDDLMVPRIADPERVWRIIAIVVTIPAAILTVIALKR
jgi:protein involved in polysaccharide export with SLBB domain